MRNEFVERLKEKFGDRLLSVGLHNVGVTSFIGKNGVFVVLDKIESGDVFAIKRLYLKYKKKYTTPIVVSDDFFESSKSLFCMEILEMKENCEILYGKNPFDSISIENDELIKQMKYELVGKSLALRGAFIDLPLDRKVVDSITYRSMYNFLLIMRNMLRIKGKLINDSSIIEEFEEEFNVNLEAFKVLRDSGRIPFDKLINIFKKYIEEVESIEKVFVANFG